MFWSRPRTSTWCQCSMLTTVERPRPSTQWIPTAAQRALQACVQSMADTLQWCLTQNDAFRCGSGHGLHLRGSPRWRCRRGCVCLRTRLTGVLALMRPPATGSCVDYVPAKCSRVLLVAGRDLRRTLLSTCPVWWNCLLDYLKSPDLSFDCFKRRGHSRPEIPEISKLSWNFRHLVRMSWYFSLLCPSILSRPLYCC